MTAQQSSPPPAMMATEFVYRLSGRVGSSLPGAHRSHSHGAGMNFVSHAKLLDQPDPRRLDLRASISNIQKQWLVRVNQQRAAITISVIVDVSPSMHFGASRSKLQVAADFVQALAYSASGLGDSVGLLAFDQVQREDLTIPARFGRGIGQMMADSLVSSTPSNANRGASIDALSECIEMIAGHSALVFVVSDFHWPLAQLDGVFDPLAGAQIVPLVIWDQAEIHPPAGKRLLSVQQMGGKTTRHVWLTPQVRQTWRDNVAQREQAITAVFAADDIKPFMMTDGFEPDALSQYFLEASVG